MCNETKNITTCLALLTIPLQYGLLDIPDLDSPGDEDLELSDDDIDLEAELAAISGGSARNRQKKRVQLEADLDAMIAASLKDVPSDDDVGSGTVSFCYLFYFWEVFLSSSN